MLDFTLYLARIQKIFDLGQVYRASQKKQQSFFSTLDSFWYLGHVPKSPKSRPKVGPKLAKSRPKIGQSLGPRSAQGRLRAQPRLTRPDPDQANVL